jgi:hypothetical protein
VPENNSVAAFKTKLAQAASPMLDVFHSLGEAALHLVAYFHADGCLNKLVFSFGPKSLVVVADEDEDTVAISIANTDVLELSVASDVSATPLWRPLLGNRSDGVISSSTNRATVTGYS